MAIVERYSLMFQQTESKRRLCNSEANTNKAIFQKLERKLAVVMNRTKAFTKSCEAYIS